MKLNHLLGGFKLVKVTIEWLIGTEIQATMYRSSCFISLHYWLWVSSISSATVECRTLMHTLIMSTLLACYVHIIRIRFDCGITQGACFSDPPLFHQLLVEPRQTVSLATTFLVLWQICQLCYQTACVATTAHFIFTFLKTVFVGQQLLRFGYV